MTREERTKIREHIETIIGTRDSWLRDSMDLSDKINTKVRYDKLFDKLFKIAENNGTKVLSMQVLVDGSSIHGVTPSGKSWTLYMNEGWTNRSRTCGTLYIDKECIFTSGTLAKSYEYILEN